MFHRILVIEGDQSAFSANKPVKICARKEVSYDHDIFRILRIHGKLMPFFIESKQIFPLEISRFHFFPTIRTFHSFTFFVCFYKVIITTLLNRIKMYCIDFCTINPSHQAPLFSSPTSEVTGKSRRNDDLYPAYERAIASVSFALLYLKRILLIPRVSSRKRSAFPVTMSKKISAVKDIFPSKRCPPTIFPPSPAQVMCRWT